MRTAKDTAHNSDRNDRGNAKPKNVYAFIDSQNLNVGVQKFGWKMDWQKFRRWLADEYGVTKAFMFIGYVPEFEPLYEQLSPILPKQKLRLKKKRSR
jgi:hypothetical protein